MMRLSEAARAIGAPAPASDALFTGVSTDSRSIQPGELFVAIAGERFDGHGYVAEVLARGAAGALVSTPFAQAHSDLPLIAVAEPRLGFAALASAWRRRFSLPVIGVVGSNGKTTAKEMCAAILRAHLGADAVLATAGNLNNDIGVPTMVLRLAAQHQAAVFELGMNHPGETAQLAPIAQANVGLINNAQREHQEFMKSVEAVAEEHALLIDALGPEGIAVFGADEAYAPLWRSRAGARQILDFGLRSGEVRGLFEPAGFGGVLHLETPWGGTEILLGVPGQHNARNACGAAAACLAAGVTLASVQRGLSAFVGVKGRLQRRTGPDGTLLIDDTYNANPDSMRAAVDVLAAIPGRRIFVMGDMGEVGDAAGQMHDEIGGYAKSHGIDCLLCLGEHSLAAAHNFGEGGEHFKQVDHLIKSLRTLINERGHQQTSVLVKGSRFMKMERVANALAIEQTTKGNDHAA
ncbi:MAG: UDP-N-acetylmuramoyl-tripeptide--D-alanyl-D-alanine ligase [Rhodocyclaceae bacterium]|jgi:UDP-N-acetylmuramoyl-tripeptide--D-alanyl-D-alanine ligase|nr:UDP-N-acetylmuramoyl-tripeptide--D-alanyl-D-alanine ligase [Rhodocyclaceae bacterium]